MEPSECVPLNRCHEQRHHSCPRRDGQHRSAGGRPVAAARHVYTRRLPFQFDPFDWFLTAGWDQVLRGATTAYVVPPRVAGPVHDLVARAEAAGVRRVVRLCGHGAGDWGDSVFGLDMRSAEDASTCTPSVSPLAAGEVALPAGAVPEPLIDLEDVADVAAAELFEPHRHAGGFYELTGPRGLTWRRQSS